MVDHTNADDFEVADPIDHGTLGRTPILSNDDCDLIIECTGLELLPEVNGHKFEHLLNNIVDRTIRAQLEERLDRKTLGKLKVSFETYREISRALVHSEGSPPLPPFNWVKEVEKWIEDAVVSLDTRASGGAAKNVEQEFFCPRALGLFHAGFGVVPDGATSLNRSGEHGAAFRFIQTTSQIVRERIQDRGFSDRIPRYLQSRARWGVVTDGAIRKRISAALKLRLDSKGGRETPASDSRTSDLNQVVRQHTDFVWIINSELFRKMISSI
jgi:hypothetical protein